MSKKFRRFISPVASILGTAVGGPLGGVVGGALGGAASGGGLKGALTGGLGGAAVGFAPQIGAFANNALGAALSGASQAALGGALGGAAAGGLTGGGSGALKGALTGGVGGYLANGGLDSISLPSSITSVLPGSAAGSTLPSNVMGGVGPTLGSGLQGLATGGGIGAIPGLSSLVPSGGGGAGNMFVSGLSALNQYGATSDMEEQMLAAQRRAEDALAPFQQTGVMANQRLGGAIESGELGGQFNFQADPGYQFRQREGEEALMRAQSARGNMFSGAALRQAIELNQELANQAYQEAFNRDLARQQNLSGILTGASSMGQNAAMGLGNIYSNMGDIQANATLGQANAITGFAADALGGDIIGYRADGTPITRQSALLGMF